MIKTFVPEYGCSLPLGLESGQVPDTAFLASSVAGSKNGSQQARLIIRTDGKGFVGWAAKENNDSQWLQIDLGELVRVTKVVTQGKQDAAHWVIQFSLSYSLDGRHWAEYKENSVARVHSCIIFRWGKAPSEDFHMQPWFVPELSS